MSNKVLIITAKTDVHADYVIMEIEKSGGEVIRLNTEDIVSNSSYSVTNDSLSPSSSFEWLIKDSNKTLTNDAFHTVYYRKPDPVLVPESIVDNNARMFIAEEYRYFLRSFYNLFSNKRWVNPFWAGKVSDQKLPNLDMAKSLGLNVPRTLVTNDPSQALDFCRNCQWNVLVKPFRFSGFKSEESGNWRCFANKFTRQQLEDNLGTISLSPTFIQEYIEKSIELRVTIIGTQVYTAAIHSQETENAQIDWRAVDSYEIQHTIFELPQDIKTRLIKFNEYFSLKFSTFDLILTPSGDYYFLECNPNGQWRWKEDLTGMPLARSMASYLLGID